MTESERAIRERSSPSASGTATPKKRRNKSSSQSCSEDSHSASSSANPLKFRNRSEHSTARLGDQSAQAFSFADQSPLNATHSDKPTDPLRQSDVTNLSLSPLFNVWTFIRNEIQYLDVSSDTLFLDSQGRERHYHRYVDSAGQRNDPSGETTAMTLHSDHNDSDNDDDDDSSSTFSDHLVAQRLHPSLLREMEGGGEAEVLTDTINEEKLDSMLERFSPIRQSVNAGESAIQETAERSTTPVLFRSKSEERLVTTDEPLEHARDSSSLSSQSFLSHEQSEVSNLSIESPPTLLRIDHSVSEPRVSAIVPPIQVPPLSIVHSGSDTSVSSSMDLTLECSSIRDELVGQSKEESCTSSRSSSVVSDTIRVPSVPRTAPHIEIPSQEPSSKGASFSTPQHRSSESISYGQAMDQALRTHGSDEPKTPVGRGIKSRDSIHRKHRRQRRRPLKVDIPSSKDRVKSANISSEGPRKRRLLKRAKSAVDLKPHPPTIEAKSVIDNLKHVAGMTRKLDSAFDAHNRVHNFLAVTYFLEPILFFGVCICVDSFLFPLTVLPLRILYNLCWVLFHKLKVRFYGEESNEEVKRIKEQGLNHLTSRDWLDLIKCLSITLSVTVLITQFNQSYVYHYIRAQQNFRLYVLLNIMSVLYRLLAAFGEDCLLSLLCTLNQWTDDRHRKRQLKEGASEGAGSSDNTPNSVSVWVLMVDLVVYVCYCLFHSILLYIVFVLHNVAINMPYVTLITLLVGNNFYEIKTTVFKRYTPDVLFQILCSDIVERFEMCLLLISILIQNYCYFARDTHTEQSQRWLEHSVKMFVVMMAMEMLVDLIKHGFVLKFNNLQSRLYRVFTVRLAMDFAESRRVFIHHLQNDKSDGFMIDPSSMNTLTVSMDRRLGFSSLPCAVLFLRCVWQLRIYGYFRFESWRQAMWTVGYSVMVVFVLKLILSWLLLRYSVWAVSKHIKREDSAKQSAGTNLSSLNSTRRYKMVGKRVPLC